MTMRVKIEDPTVTSRTFPEKEGRAAFTARSQSGYLLAGKLVMPLNLRLSQDQAPYAPGDYIVDDESFGVDEYENISVRRGGLKLKSALVTEARRPAAAS